MSLGLLRLREMKLQWHDKMEAGEAVMDSVSAAISEVLNQMFYSKFLLSLFLSLHLTLPCLALSHSNTQCTSFSVLLSVFLCLVNSVINHPVTVTELLLIVILQLPCLIVFLPWFSPFSLNVHQAFLLSECWISASEWTSVKSSLWLEKELLGF